MHTFCMQISESQNPPSYPMGFECSNWDQPRYLSVPFKFHRSKAMGCLHQVSNKWQTLAIRNHQPAASLVIVLAMSHSIPIISPCDGHLKYPPILGQWHIMNHLYPASALIN